MSDYRVYVTPAALAAAKRLPGHVRHRVRRAIGELTSQPRPTAARRLSFPGSNLELWRVRLDKWRIVYLICEAEKTVDVLAVRRRPPYDYGDLESLLKDYGDQT